MPSRGPGKFSDDLDAAIYELSLDGGPDEEVGSSTEAPGTWAGLMRNGKKLAVRIRRSRISFLDSQGSASEEDPFGDVTEADLEFLCEDGAAGVIITESSSGGVDVAYYADEDDLEADWEECALLRQRSVPPSR
jgi:hypothetical protein